MNNFNIIKICKSTFHKLLSMNYESDLNPNPQCTLIFPQKRQKKGIIKRISEQELRLLFIECIKEEYKNSLFYSIETPTEKKYRFVDGIENFKQLEDKNCQSALIDLTIFQHKNNKLERIFIIEFKYKAAIEGIAKDIFKLMREQQSGAFIILLKNSNKKTIPDRLKKIEQTLIQYKDQWNNLNKEIYIIFIILHTKELHWIKINKANIGNIESIPPNKSLCLNS